MAHPAKNYTHLIGTIPGLSEKQLRAHFELYQGYVKKWGEIEERLKTADPKSAIERDFGSLKGWFDQLKAGLISEPGWVLLTRSRQDGSLRNDLLEEHHIGVLVEQDIILAFDGWEHAYFIDYATKKADYIATLERAIHWDVATRRFETSELRSQMTAAA